MSSSKKHLLPTSFNVSTDRRTLVYAYKEDKKNKSGKTSTRDSSDYTRMSKIEAKRQTTCCK